jgi:hypothetical protein
MNDQPWQQRRQRMVQAIVSALDPLEFVNAVWQGGAAAFDRVDEWSDIDLVIDAQDDRADDVWPAIERAIESLGGAELCYRIPQPPLGLHAQRFYRLHGAGPFLLVDVGVFKASCPDKLLDPDTHGQAVVHFDRTGATKSRVLPSQERLVAIDARLAVLRVTFPLFQSLVIKELNRGNPLEAIAFYHAWTLRPLVELLRIRHCPQRYQFHTRYVQYDLPRDIVERLTPLFFVRDADELSARRAEAQGWATELLSAG